MRAAEEALRAILKAEAEARLKLKLPKSGLRKREPDRKSSIGPERRQQSKLRSLPCRLPRRGQ
jgi:hypothetical protein